MKTIEMLDSTLRDGMQGKNVALSVGDKLRILQALDDFGITYIEAGYPASNEKDHEFFKRAKGHATKTAVVCAFGSTRHKDFSAENDPALQTLAACFTEIAVIFGKSHIDQVGAILEVTPDENLRIIADTVSFLVSKGKTVFFDAEHFFDGYKTDSRYAMQTLEAAKHAGAKRLILCDTNGGCFPHEIGEMVAAANAAYPDMIGIHCHDDTGCAVANSVAAVMAGAVQVQGTFIGVGERVGNANLSAVIANLQLKLGYACVPNLTTLTQTARCIADVANLNLPDNLPYVGTSAFAHKGGTHAHGMLKMRGSYEHVDPDSVGNERALLLSEVSGRTALADRIEAITQIKLDKGSPQTQALLNKVKRLENDGYQFEAADASLAMLALRALGLFKPYFSICFFDVTSSQKSDGGFSLAKAIVKVKVGDTYEITADEGSGPVSAIDRALRKALEVFYPILTTMKLSDYKVRVVDRQAHTAATTRVLIESEDGKDSWTTVGASRDIIEASVQALCDAIDYLLWKHGDVQNKNIFA
jgi:2-isopropylmalate synthase